VNLLSQGRNDEALVSRGTGLEPALRTKYLVLRTECFALAEGLALRASCDAGTSGRWRPFNGAIDPLPTSLLKTALQNRACGHSIVGKGSAIAMPGHHPLRSQLRLDVFPDPGGSIQQRRHLFELDIEDTLPRQRARC
jgi:hypothetical protein